MEKHLHLENIADMYELLPGHVMRHPLIALIDFNNYDGKLPEGTNITMGFYAVMFKNRCVNRIKYGRKSYDFQAGSLLCMAPHQVVSMGEALTEQEEVKGWGLFFHPDLLHRSSLGQTIKNYSFFGYATNEALHLSEEERHTLSIVVGQLQQELTRGIDRHTRPVLLSGIELLLNHCSRFYERQFITRSSVENDVLERFETALHTSMHATSLRRNGMPTVAMLAEQVHLSPNYLSDLLKRETGQSPLEHIHRYVVEEAKTRLLSTRISVSELAYDLGFEYPQYFSRLFKEKTGVSPKMFRRQGDIAAFS